MPLPHRSHPTTSSGGRPSSDSRTPSAVFAVSVEPAEHPILSALTE